MGVARQRDLPMPSEEERQYVGVGNFKEIGDDFLRLFTRLGGLKTSEDVLNVGCGIGRMALAMVNHLDPASRYEGFDIVKHGIEWCQRNISTRWPNFQFKHSDIYNKCYNEAGREAPRCYRFPYEDNSFDFAFLTSVFTHTLPRDLENYLGEIHRVLRPGGRAFITFFILNKEVESLIAQGKVTFKLQHRRGPCRVENPQCPEQVVGYEEGYLVKTFKESGFAQPLSSHPGVWCGREKGENSHDLVIATKRGEATKNQRWRRKLASWMPWKSNLEALSCPLLVIW